MQPKIRKIERAAALMLYMLGIVGVVLFVLAAYLEGAL